MRWFISATWLNQEIFKAEKDHIFNTLCAREECIVRKNTPWGKDQATKFNLDQLWPISSVKMGLTLGSHQQSIEPTHQWTRTQPLFYWDDDRLAKTESGFLVDSKRYQAQIYNAR